MKLIQSTITKYIIICLDLVITYSFICYYTIIIVNITMVTQLDNYDIVAKLLSGDLHAKDRFNNHYILAKKGSTATQSKIKTLSGFFIEPYDHVANQQAQHYTVYQFPRDICWIASIDNLQFKSEFYCLTLLYGLVNQICKVIINMGPECLDLLELENIWVKNKSVILLLHPRSKKYHQSSNLMQLQKIVLEKVGHLMKPVFRVGTNQKTFLSVLISSMINGDLNFRQFTDIMNNKKQRRKFMQQNKNSENIVFVSQELWNQKQPTSRNRRSLKNTATHDRPKIGMDLRIQLPPSVARKRNGFNIFSDSKSQSRSKSKHRHYFKDERSKSKSSNRYEDLLYKTQIHSRDASRDASYSIDIQTIDRNMRERALQKFQENKRTIDVAQLSHKQKSNKISAQKDSYIRNLMTRQNAERKFNESYMKREDSHNKFIISKKPSGQIQNRPQVRRELFNEKYKGSEIKNTINREIQEREEKRLEEKEKKTQEDKIRETEREKQKKAEQARQEEKRQKLEQQERERKQKEKMKEIERQIEKEIRSKKEREIEQQIRQKKQREIEQQLRQMKEKQREQKLRKEKEKQIEDEIRQKKEREIEEEYRKKKQLEENIKKNQQVQPSQKTNRSIKLQNQKDKFNSSSISAMDSERNKGNSKYFNNIEEIEQINNMVALIDKKDYDKGKVPPLPKKKKPQQEDDEIQEINFENKKSFKKQPSSSNIKKQQKADEKQTAAHKRVNTNQSSVASSYGPKKPVHKQVAEYMHMINKIGQAVAKSSKLSAKLKGVEWYTGVYFLYKRFLFERKKIQKWLSKGQHKITRYPGDAEEVQWIKWYSQPDKEKLLSKTQAQNKQIVDSIIKMNRKIIKKNLPGNFQFHASLDRQSEEESKIAVSEVVREFDVLEEKNLMRDPEILSHINDLINSLQIIGELDGKIKEKKPLMELFKKKNVEELSELADILYDIYIPEEE